MDNSPFAMHPSILENNLFLGHSGKKGKSQLSANFLPHLFHYVKTLLSETERNSLKDYDVQIFIIETAIGQKRFTDLNVICDYVIKEIRNDIKYWIKNTEPFMKIYEQVKEQGENDEKIDAAILSMKEENENAFKEYRDYNSKVANIYNDEMENDASLSNNENKVGYKKTQCEQYMKPTIQEFIPDSMDFNFKTFETTLETYYTNKNDNPVKKIRTRWQDRRDKQLLSYPQEMVKNYVGVFKEMRDNDPNFARNIFFCDRSQKIPRIENQLFPTIFQFLMKKYNLSLDVKTTEQVFLFHRVQNLIYLCLLTDDKSHVLCNPNRVSKGAFLENINEANDFEVEEELNEEDKKEGDEDEQGGEKEEVEDDDDEEEETENELLSEFKTFSQNSNGIIVETLFGTDKEMKQRKFNLLLNCLRICKIFIEKIWKWELSVIPSLDAQDASFDNFKVRELIHKLDSTDDFSDEILETIIDYYHLDFEHKNIWKYLENMLQYKTFLLKEAPKTEKEEIQGAFSSKEFCLVSIENYQNYFDDPTIAKKRSYIFHTSHRKKFSSEECRKFLEGLHKFYDTPVNNKKIAKHIGPHIKSNHVRFIKNLYLRRLRKKAKAQNTPIRDLLKSDMETNNIKEVLEFL